MESLAPQEGQTSWVESSAMLLSSPVRVRTGRTRPSLASVLSWAGRRVRSSRLLMEYQRSPGWRASRLISPASAWVRSSASSPGACRRARKRGSPVLRSRRTWVWSSFSLWPVGARTMPQPERPQERQYRAGRAGSSARVCSEAASAQRKEGREVRARSTRVTSRIHRVISTPTAPRSGAPSRPARTAERAARTTARVSRAGAGSWVGPMSVRARSVRAVACWACSMRARTSGWA